MHAINRELTINSSEQRNVVLLIFEKGARSKSNSADKIHVKTDEEAFLMSSLFISISFSSWKYCAALNVRVQYDLKVLISEEKRVIASESLQMVAWFFPDN